MLTSSDLLAIALAAEHGRSLMIAKRARLQADHDARVQHARARDAESFRRHQIEADELEARRLSK